MRCRGLAARRGWRRSGPRGAGLQGGQEGLRRWARGSAFPLAPPARKPLRPWPPRRQQISSLDIIVGIYNRLQRTILPVERPLVQQKLEAVEAALQRGLAELNWRAEGIEGYIAETLELVRELDLVLGTVKDNVRRTRWAALGLGLVLGALGAATMVALPSCQGCGLGAVRCQGRRAAHADGGLASSSSCRAAAGAAEAAR